jgi:opacity protein-like surface antigen
MKATFQPLSFVLVVLVTTETNAQLHTSKYEAGANIGTYIYQGDLTPNRFGSLKTMQPGLGLYGTRYFSSSWGVRANLSFARLKGDDAKYNTPAYRQQRNFNFRTPVLEFSAVAVWKPFADNYLKEGNGTLSPYLFGGAGLSLLRVRRDASNFNADYFAEEPAVLTGLATDLARRTPRLLPVIPVGAGVQYGLTDQWFLHLETTYRYSFSDYIDGFSRAANPKRRDAYYNISIGATFKFGKSNSWKCPPVR